jgi:sugar phosphate isomerase/epimerase
MTLSRRSFFHTVSTTGAAGLLSRESSANDPIRRSSGPRMKLSLAAYSFRQYLQGQSKSMSYEDFIDLAATYGIEGIEPTSYYFPADVTAEYLRKFRRKAFLLGMDISSTSVGNVFTHPPGPDRDKELAHVRKWVDNAVAMNAPCIRIFAGNVQKGTTEEQARTWAIECLRESCRYAGERGIILALENHGGIVTTADQTLSFLKEIDSEWFGLNLDTGNFRSEDPYEELERVAPYAVTVQVKTEITPKGKPRQDADLAREIDILKKVGYRGYVVLEYEAKEDPKTAVPRILQTLRTLIS